MAKKVKMKHSAECLCEHCHPTYVEPMLSGKQYETLYEVVKAVSVEKHNGTWFVNIEITSMNSDNREAHRVMLDAYEHSYSYWTNPQIIQATKERRERLATDPRFNKN